MLPKLDVPVYEIKLPLLNKTVRYRPFLVKEEKILLMAMESNDEKTIFDSIKQIVNNCCIDELNIDTLPILDLEYFFLNLRAKSVGEVVELKYKCNNKVKKENSEEEKECGNLVSFDVNLLEVKAEIDSKHTNKIELTDKMGIVMKYPNFKLFEIYGNESDVENTMNFIFECVDYVYDEENIYYKKDVTTEELKEFIESLNREQFSKIQNFFQTLPKLRKSVHFACGKCGYSEDLDIEGLQNFFV